LILGVQLMYMDPNYFRGVAVGLLIAGVTSAIAYYVVSYVRHQSSSRLLPKLVLFEVAVSIIMYVAYLFLK
jgi:predicted PurR-regulated permease PerM